MAAWQLILGSLPLLGLPTLVEGGTLIVWSGEFVGLLLFLSLVVPSFATVLCYWLLQREDVGSLTMFLFLVPVADIALAAAVFDERIGLLESARVVLALAGTGTTLWERRQRWAVATDNPGTPVGVAPRV